MPAATSPAQADPSPATTPTTSATTTVTAATSVRRIASSRGEGRRQAPSSVTARSRP